MNIRIGNNRLSSDSMNFMLSTIKIKEKTGEEYDNMDKMPWGKHKGLVIKFIPTSYLQWVRDNCDWDDVIVVAFEEEINRRTDENDHVWK